MSEAIDERNRARLGQEPADPSVEHSGSAEDDVTLDYNLIGFAEAFNTDDNMRAKFCESLTWAMVELDSANCKSPK